MTTKANALLKKNFKVKTVIRFYVHKNDTVVPFYFGLQLLKIAINTISVFHEKMCVFLRPRFSKASDQDGMDQETQKTQTG